MKQKLASLQGQNSMGSADFGGNSYGQNNSRDLSDIKDVMREGVSKVSAILLISSLHQLIHHTL